MSPVDSSLLLLIWTNLKITDDPSPATEDKKANLSPSKSCGIELLISKTSKLETDIRIPTNVKKIPTDVRVFGAIAEN